MKDRNLLGLWRPDIAATERTMQQQNASSYRTSVCPHLSHEEPRCGFPCSSEVCRNTRLYNPILWPMVYAAPNLEGWWLLKYRAAAGVDRPPAVIDGRCWTGSRSA